MYGFRDASHGWQEDWQELLRTVGYKVEVANPALVCNPQRATRGGVHGDDFYIFGPRSSIDHMGQVLKSKYSVRESHCLGWGDHCSREATVLNRVVVLGEDENRRRYVRIEPDQRHVELTLKSLGFNERTKSCATPSVKLKDHEVEARRSSPPLSPGDTTAFRSCVMRGSFLAQDRADLGESVKSLAQGMAKPTKAYWEDLERLGRYLVGRPHATLEYRQQAVPKRLTCNVDSDHAADKMTRRSTTGMTVMFGEHLIKNTSNLQTSIGLNVAEAEFYALCHGGAHGLGIQAFLRDLGCRVDVRVASDSSSAKSFSSRRGLGKQRHVQTRCFWIQERVACNHLQVHKIPGTTNTADILTKSTTPAVLDMHLRTLGYTFAPFSKLHKKV